MAFATGTPQNTFAFIPTREIILAIDPQCVPVLVDPMHMQELRLVSDLRHMEVPITISLLLPCQLTTPEIIAQASNITALSLITDRVALTFKLKNDFPSKFSEPLLANTEDSNRTLSLLGLADAIQADGIVTNEQVLLDARYALYQYHSVRIIPLAEFGDFVEIFAHGHSVFWPATTAIRKVTFDVFYQWCHWKNRRYTDWFQKFDKTKNAKVEECLRSALLNRYPFLLYSRDMIRFYEIQMDFYARRGLQRRFSMAVGFYVTNFYLLLWGMLDHLTIIAKWACELAIEERFCGIRSKQFWEEFNLKDSHLYKFLKQPNIDEWISQMADMRNAAAHKTIALPTPLLAETDESRKGDKEILKIIQKERGAAYKILPPELMKAMEPMMINLWRLRKMKVIAPSIVYLKGKKEHYLRDPVISVDDDLDYLTAIMDAFLVALFR
jgi:hypothetical protein